MNVNLNCAFNPGTEVVSKPAMGQLNGKNVITMNSYQNKKDLAAGVGPQMFNGIGRGFVTAMMLFATALTSAVVTYATLDRKIAAITAGVGVGLTILTNLFLRATDPTF